MRITYQSGGGQEDKRAVWETDSKVAKITSNFLGG